MSSSRGRLSLRSDCWFSKRVSSSRLQHWIIFLAGQNGKKTIQLLKLNKIYIYIFPCWFPCAPQEILTRSKLTPQKRLSRSHPPRPRLDRSSAVDRGGPRHEPWLASLRGAQRPRNSGGETAMACRTCGSHFFEGTHKKKKKKTRKNPEGKPSLCRREFDTDNLLWMDEIQFAPA